MDFLDQHVNWIIPIMFIGGIVNILVFKFYTDEVSMKQGQKMGVTFCRFNKEDCMEASKMLVDFLSDSLREEGSKREETSAGCDSLFVLRSSKDIPKLVKSAHLMGGRLVLRKKEDGDIERTDNNKLYVQRELTDLDIERAKRINKKYRR